MSFTHDLSFVAMVGSIDPLRSEAKEAVQVALGAGIDVRIIAGDHSITAKAIGETLGLGAGAISGAEPRRCRTRSWPGNCPTSMCSVGCHRRTSCAWLGSCSRRASSSP